MGEDKGFGAKQTQQRVRILPFRLCDLAKVTVTL